MKAWNLPSVPLKELGSGGAAAQPAKLARRLGGPHLLIGASLEELADPEPTSVVRGFARG